MPVRDSGLQRAISNRQALSSLMDASRQRRLVMSSSQVRSQVVDMLQPEAMKLTTNDKDGFVPDPQDAGMSEATFNKFLQKMIAASGGKLKVTSGKRSTKRQAELWAAALKKYGSPEKARKWVAPPGKSKHELGLAADLAYADAAAREWAHKNAGQFGLVFPLGNEPWHVELRGARGGGHAHKGHAHGKGKAQPSPPRGGALQELIRRESGGRTSAKNPKSSAFGLGQLIVANRRRLGKKLGINPDTTDYGQQLRMMEEYIRERYGSPEKALEFHNRKGWY